MRIRKPTLLAAGLLTVCALGCAVWLLGRGGQGSPTPPSPVIDIGPACVAPAITRGYGGLIVLAPDGSLWGWGDSAHGELGPVQQNLVAPPVRIGRQSGWRAVASGYRFTIGLKTNGTLWGWGASDMLIGSDPVDAVAPVQVTADRDWVDVQSGSSHVVGLRADGTAWTWGFNTLGQLGDGTRQDQCAAQPVDSHSRWATLAVGLFHAAGIKQDGSLWVWGDDPLSDQNRPTPIGQETNWVAVWTGPFHTLAAKRDGSWWVWGRNAPLLTGLPESEHSIQRITNALPWMAVAGGSSHALALLRDGSLWAWGVNARGQLAAGDRVRRTVPARSGAHTDWVAVGACGDVCAGLATDHSLRVWGVRMDVPPRVRVNLLSKAFGWLLNPLGIDAGPPNTILHSYTPEPQVILRFRVAPQ